LNEPPTEVSRYIAMVIDDLEVLFSSDDASQIYGGLYADANVNTYVSPNLSYADANANAIGQFTWASTHTQANLYQGQYSGNSRAYAQADAYASEGSNHYWVRATEIRSYWW
jgi:hypothetical protein